MVRSRNISTVTPIRSNSLSSLSTKEKQLSSRENEYSKNRSPSSLRDTINITKVLKVSNSHNSLLQLHPLVGEQESRPNEEPKQSGRSDLKITTSGDFSYYDRDNDTESALSSEGEACIKNEENESTSSGEDSLLSPGSSTYDSTKHSRYMGGNYFSGRGKTATEPSSASEEDNYDKEDILFSIGREDVSIEDLERLIQIEISMRSPKNSTR